MSKLVTIYGGSGFLGRYIARRMAKAGWRVRVAVRRPNEAMFVRTYGAVGQVEPVLCNIRDDASVRSVMQGANAVVNCVGTFDAKGRNNFDAVQAEGAERIARTAADLGVARMVHISAIGADISSKSKYQQTKAEGEAAVAEHMPGAMLLRPSIIFGAEDGFFNRFASMSRMGPVLPVVGADTRFQPVYVDDVAHAAELGLTSDVEGGVYELGGPNVESFRDLMKRMLKVIRRRRLILNMPFPIAGLMAWGFDLVQTLSGGLIHNAMLTRDQVKSLKSDNIVGPEAKTLEDLGIRATAMEAVLPDYLWRFRPSGQYEALKESASKLKV